MISFLYIIFAYFHKRMPKRIFGVIKFNTLIASLTLRFMNAFLPLYFKLTSNNSNYRVKEFRPLGERVIVSLTSFPKRIGKVWLTIESLLRQDTHPDKIILWLSQNQFPSLSCLPSNLLSLQDRGVEIRLVSGDIRSYKKYQYVIEEYPEDLIVLVDDDFFYNSDLITELLSAHHRYPNALCARYGYEMKFNSDGTISKYRTWSFIKEPKEPSFSVFFGSGGGTLFKKEMMYRDIENIKLALQLCPTADDIYLNAMARLNNTPICFANGLFVLVSLAIEDNEMLADVNIGELAQNDIQINNINEYFYSNMNKRVF